MTDDLFGNSYTLTENLNAPMGLRGVYRHQNAVRTPEISSDPVNRIESDSVKPDPPTKSVKEILGGGYIPPPDKNNLQKSQISALKAEVTNAWISALEAEVANAFQCGEGDDLYRHAEVKYFTNGYVNVVITNDITKYRQLDVNLPDKLGKINVFVKYLNDATTNVSWLCVSTGDYSDNLNIAYATNVLNSLNVESTIITNSYLDSIDINKSINCNAYAGAARQSNPDVLKLFSPTEVTVFFAYSHGE